MHELNWIKSFDSVDQDYVCSALQKFGYGDKFIHMIKIVVTKIKLK